MRAKKLTTGGVCGRRLYQWNPSYPRDNAMYVLGVGGMNRSLMGSLLNNIFSQDFHRTVTEFQSSFTIYVQSKKKIMLEILLLLFLIYNEA